MQLLDLKYTNILSAALQLIHNYGPIYANTESVVYGYARTNFSLCAQLAYVG